MTIKKVLFANLLLIVLGFATAARAQFSSSLQGITTDATGAVIPGVTVVVTNTDTQVSATATTGAQGEYRFLSLAPGPYDVAASAKGFATHKVSVTLATNQTMNLPFTMGVSNQTVTVEVTDRPPVLDTAENRTQLTLTTEALTDLPLPGHDLLGLTTLAPGVTGLGLLGSGGNGQSNDNYAAETQLTASANGRSSVGNMFVLDGLDITSNITPGVLNLVPNPDTISETTVQVNMFNVEYGRSSSIVQVMTSKSGVSQYHFLASQYYTANWLTARTEFQPVGAFPPFHSVNISAAASGPVPKIHQMYFFTGWEPLLSSTQSPGAVTYEDPAFTAWAATAWPNSIGVGLLKQYPSTNATTTSVAKKGSDLFPLTSSTPCGTPSAANIPCALPVVDNGVFNATNTRNALQYNVRIDKYFSKDRLYGNYYRTGLDLGGPSVRVGHDQPQHYIVRSLQGNETHTFSANMLNNAAFGVLRMEGLINPTGPFHVPIITVTNAWGTQLGVSKADENYIQYHYVWRDA
ncbi:MAG TPA: carboxypeptidase-like regulatory domain-containing protein, partial [Planctomycetota bacterium]|nr:carboxypeptidase-like regulatory domain-containing protein [Planctomycetota bacterium]